MVKIKLQDQNFLSGDAKSSSRYYVSEKFQWCRKSGTGDVVVFSDRCLSLAKLPLHKNAFKVAWLLEPLEIDSGHYQHALTNYSDFDLILSHDIEFLSKIPNGEWIPACMTWVAQEDWGTYIGQKTKQVSIIASSKTQTTGHKLRHEIIKRFGGRIDVFGSGYRSIENKTEALGPYKYTIVIENSWRDSYFTEKFVDSLATSTMPIYWGTYGTNEIFDYVGIARIKKDDPINSLENWLEVLKYRDLYKESLYAIENNFAKAFKYRCQEDFIYEILERKGLISA